MTNEQFLVPSKIDFKQIFDSVAISDRYYHDHVDKYHYIIHKIIEGRVFNRQIASDGYTQLNYEVLRAFLGKRYASQVLNDLKAWCVIECDNHFIKGVKSYGYRIAPAFVSKSILRDVFKAEVWDNKLAKQHAAYKARVGSSVEWDNLSKFGVRDEAFAYVEQKLTRSLAALDKYKVGLNDVAQEGYYLAILSKFSVTTGTLYLLSETELATVLRKDKSLTAHEALVNHAISSHDADLMSLTKIKQEKWFVEQPDAQSRIFTNLTNLATDLRQFLYHRDKEENLINMDLRNSQPYLFCLLLKDKYRDEMPEKAQKYIDLTSSGSFYEYVMDKMQVKAHARAQFKITFFAKIFFCTTRYSKTTAEGKLFAAEFPEVYDLINEYKLSGYEQLSIEMQRREAGVLLRVIGKQLAQGGVWFASIHDSIVVMKEHAEQVKKLIIDSFAAAVGVAPTIKEEVLAVG